MDVPKVLIIIDGGIVHKVLSDTSIDIIVADYDIDGLEDNKLVSVNGESCYIYPPDSAIDIQSISHFFKKAKEGDRI